MKSERRHELQQNDLAAYLDRINRSVEPYSKIIAVVLAVLVIGGIGITFYSSEQRGMRSEATLHLLQASGAGDAEEMLRVSESYPKTAASAWARLYQGTLYLTQGIQSLYRDRNNAEQLLEDAQAAFRYAIANSNDPLLRSRANYGIARAAESLGNVDDAIAAYNDVIAANESEAMVNKAEERIATLSKPRTKDFLAWFGDQDFSPPDPSLPPALPGSSALPGMPDLNLPELKLDSSGDVPTKDLEGGIELPSEGAEPSPAGETDNAADNESAGGESAAEPTAGESSESESGETAGDESAGEDGK